MEKKRLRKSEYKLIACPETRKHANPCWVFISFKEEAEWRENGKYIFFVQKNSFNKIFTKETITMLYRPNIVHLYVSLTFQLR